MDQLNTVYQQLDIPECLKYILVCLTADKQYSIDPSNQAYYKSSFCRYRDLLFPLNRVCAPKAVLANSQQLLKPIPYRRVASSPIERTGHRSLMGTRFLRDVTVRVLHFRSQKQVWLLNTHNATIKVKLAVQEVPALLRQKGGIGFCRPTGHLEHWVGRSDVRTTPPQSRNSALQIFFD